MSLRRAHEKYRRDPLEDGPSAAVPGENRHRPRDVAWYASEYDPGCDCMWNWGDGPESIDGSPRQMYWYPKVRPVNRIQDRADHVLEYDARRARNQQVSAIAKKLDPSPNTTTDWTLCTQKVRHILSHAAPGTTDRLDELLEYVLSFVQNAPSPSWRTFLSSMDELHPDYFPVLPWFRLREARRPLPRHEKGLTPHLIREWAHRLIGSDLALSVLATNLADRHEISSFLQAVKQSHPSWHDEFANAFSLGAATLRSMDYPPFQLVIQTETRKRTFDVRPVSKTEVLDPAFTLGDWLWGQEALLAPEVVHYRFFEGDLVLPGHLSLFEATVRRDVETNARRLVGGCFGFQAPKELFHGRILDDLFHLLRVLVLSRGAQNFYVTKGSYRPQASDVPLQTLERRSDVATVLMAADSILDHANARVGSAVTYFGQQAFEISAMDTNQSCFLPENQLELLQLQKLPIIAPKVVAQSEEGPVGIISDFPR